MQPETTEDYRLVLTGEEHSVLSEILTNYLSDLRIEIVDTDSIEFKNGLKVRKGVILGLIAKLESQDPQD